MGFAGLYDQGDDGTESGVDDGGGGGNVHSFMLRYGWHHSAELVADLERITLAQAYNLNTTAFLNGLAYLKAKRAYEREQLKQMSNGKIT